jgi:GNAT superfamily N-acetyltransferase
MDIRPLTISDYDAIISLWKVSGLPIKPEGRDSEDEMKIQLKKDPDLALGAFLEGDLVGVIIGSDDGRKGWINRLAVKPEHRRKGVAVMLIEATEKALKERGRQIICTLVEDWNDVSMQVFKEAGYIKHEDILYLSKREGDFV